jgi:hypothetical protein
MPPQALCAAFSATVALADDVQDLAGRHRSIYAGVRSLLVAHPRHKSGTESAAAQLRVARVYQQHDGRFLSNSAVGGRVPAERAADHRCHRSIVGA